MPHIQYGKVKVGNYYAYYINEKISVVFIIVPSSFLKLECIWVNKDNTIDEWSIGACYGLFSENDDNFHGKHIVDIRKLTKKEGIIYSM